MLFIQFRWCSVPESTDSTTDDLQEVTSRLLTVTVVTGKTSCIDARVAKFGKATLGLTV